MQNINWLMAFLILAWFVVTIIYIVVRATKSLKLGKATAYGVWVLVMEVRPPTPPPTHPIQLTHAPLAPTCAKVISCQQQLHFWFADVHALLYLLVQPR